MMTVKPQMSFSETCIIIISHYFTMSKNQTNYTYEFAYTKKQPFQLFTTIIGQPICTERVYHYTPYKF